IREHVNSYMSSILTSLSIRIHFNIPSTSISFKIFSNHIIHIIRSNPSNQKHMWRSTLNMHLSFHLAHHFLKLKLFRSQFQHLKFLLLILFFEFQNLLRNLLNECILELEMSSQIVIQMLLQFHTENTFCATFNRALNFREWTFM